VHNVGDHQIRINDVGVINDVDALKSMPCDNLDAASSWQKSHNEYLMERPLLAQSGHS
jgi:hypothetical protein